MLLAIVGLLTLALWPQTARAQLPVAYANDFVDPNYVLQGKFGAQTAAAQQTILSWATQLASNGPWSVTNKSVTPPSGDKHDYISWAPYWWPDCSKADNKTVLSTQEIWATCPYVRRDGQFNSDVTTLDNNLNFWNMSEAVFYNTLASVIAEDPKSKATFEGNAVNFLDVWFLNPLTRMNPNMNFGQMIRGPGGKLGAFTGVLDLHAMTKVSSAILILRKGKAASWTAQLDSAMVAWCNSYIEWLQTATIAIEASHAKNNHATFFYNQLAGLKLIVNDVPGALNATQTYFNNQFKNQIEASGEQPLEAARTRPYHYRAFNIAAMITNARLQEYTDPSSKPFQLTTHAGGNIQKALNFAMTFNASAIGEGDFASDLYPLVAAGGAIYGDPKNNYLNYLKAQDPNFLAQPYMFWNQPFAVNAVVGSSKSGGSKSSTPGSTQDTGGQGGEGTSTTNTSSALSSVRTPVWTLTILSFAVLSLL